MFLAGAHDLTVDTKNRLSIPFAIRRKLSEELDGHSFYVMPGRRKGTLALYPEKYFERLRSEVPPDDALTDEAYEWRQFEYANSPLLEPDNQGRVLFPERMLRRAGLERDVTLLGVRDHLELWSRKDYEAFEAAMWDAYPERRTRAIEEVKQLVPAGKTGATPMETSANERATGLGS